MTLKGPPTRPAAQAGLSGQGRGDLRHSAKVLPAGFDGSSDLDCPADWGCWLGMGFSDGLGGSACSDCGAGLGGSPG